MRRFTAVSLLTILATLALSAIAVATASALENVEVLPSPTKTTPLKFTAKGLAGDLEGEQSGSAIECKEVSVPGEFTSTNLGVATLTMTGCKSPLNGAKCESLPEDKAGTLELKADVHLVDVLLPAGEPLPELMLGVAVILLELLHVQCGVSLLLLIGGAIIGEFNKSAASGEKTKEGTVDFEQTKGVQKVKECDLDKAFCFEKTTHKTFGLYTEAGKGREKSGIKQEGAITLEKEAAFDY
jgi:hypothetical protein